MDERDERLGVPDGQARPRNGNARSNPSGGAREALPGALSAAERVSQEREAEEREFTEDRELTDDDRLEMFRASMFQSVLPDLPPRRGYHSIWLTTTNARDSISQRMRLGYVLARAEDCPGWQGLHVSAGGLSDVLGINEMVGAYLPMRLFNLYMKEAHHDAPLREEEKLRSAVDVMSEQAGRMGARVELGDQREGTHGMTALVQERAGRLPVFRE